VPLSATVLSAGERAQANATSDAIIKKIVTLIPEANSPGNFFISSAVSPVDIHQGTANVSHSFSDAHRVNVYYAMQHDSRKEPPTTQGSNLPGYGDSREGWRQVLTFNDTKVFSSTLVNEARLGYNRIHITFDPATPLTAADFGINNGAIGFPQITVVNANTLAFGGINGFPQGRGDYTAVFSDSLNWIHGNHSFKFGGEYRRTNNNNFTYTPGTFGFASIAAFLADQANAFTANPSNRASRIYVNALGAFVQDSFKVKPNLLLELGLRYDWNGTPTEAANRFVVFDPVADSLVQIGKGVDKAYQQNALNFEPRVGFSWMCSGTARR